MDEIKIAGVTIEKKTPGVRCGYCPKVIWKDDEPNGRLFLLAGKPICIVCRLKRSKNWKQIAADIRKKRPKDLDRIAKEAQEKANKQVEDLAVKSKDTETGLKK